MRIISRTVLSPHAKEEVFRILKNANYQYYSSKFIDDSFQIAFPMRWHKKTGIIPVKGTANDLGNATKVHIEVHGGVTFYLSWLFLGIGISLFLYSILSKVFNFYPAVIVFGISVVIYVIDLFDGIVCLDSLEHRLTRKL